MEIKIYSFPEMLMKFKSSTKNIQNESQQKLFEKKHKSENNERR